MFVCSLCLKGYLLFQLSPYASSYVGIHSKKFIFNISMYLVFSIRRWRGVILGALVLQYSIDCCVVNILGSENITKKKVNK